MKGYDLLVNGSPARPVQVTGRVEHPRALPFPERCLVLLLDVLLQLPHRSRQVRAARAAHHRLGKMGGRPTLVQLAFAGPLISEFGLKFALRQRNAQGKSSAKTEQFSSTRTVTFQANVIILRYLLQRCPDRHVAWLRRRAMRPL